MVCFDNLRSVDRIISSIFQWLDLAFHSGDLTKGDVPLYWQQKEDILWAIGKERIQVGLVFIEGTVTGPTGKQATLKFLVDSGATYTLLPNKVWRAIGLKPIDSVKCILADGSEIERKVSECQIALPQGQRHTPVMLGEKGDEALLGVVTLEILGLILHPYTRKLQPMRMLLVCRKRQRKGGMWIRPDPLAAE